MVTIVINGLQKIRYIILRNQKKKKRKNREKMMIVYRTDCHIILLTRMVAGAPESADRKFFSYQKQIFS